MLLIVSPAHHLTAAQVSQAQALMLGKPSPDFNRREVESLLGPPIIEGSRRAISWCGWTYSLRGYHEVYLSIDLDNQEEPVGFACTDKNCSLWARLKQKFQ
jgi:hypothetical protein